MGKLTGADKIGLRDKDSKELIAVYPYKSEGTDVEIEKSVRDWYYQQSCEAEEIMRNAYVDILTDTEMKYIKNK